MNILFARIISRLTGPFTVVPAVTLYILFFHTGIMGQLTIPFLLLFFASVLLIPGGIFSIFILQGRISDVDVRNREERVPLLASILPSVWIAVYAAHFYHVPALFLYLIFSGALTLTILFAITLWYKVSLHTSGITVLFFMVFFTVGALAWWVVPILALVWWARLTIKAHSIPQLLLGTLIPVVVFLTLESLMLK